MITVRKRLLSALTASALAIAPTCAEEALFDIHLQAQPLSQAILELSAQTNAPILARSALLSSRIAPDIRGRMTVDDALEKLLAPVELSYEKSRENVYRIIAEAEPSIEARPVIISPLTDRVDEIVVTGTNIRTVSNIRGAPTDSAPLQIFDRRAIDQSGVARASDFLQMLPVNSAGSGPNLNVAPVPIFDGNGAPIGFDFEFETSTIDRRSPNLRFLGGDATLVLVNGRRQAVDDLSLLPFTAINRIEILNDGGSAIYGANAVAGAVNVILEDELDGAHSVVRYGKTADSGAEQYLAGASVGGVWRDGSVNATYEYYRQADLFTADRPASFPFRIIDVEAPGLFCASCTQIPLTPEIERHSSYVRLNQSLPSAIEIFSEGRITVARSSIDNGSFVNSANFREFSGTVGAAAELNETWRVEASGHFNRHTNDQSRKQKATLWSVRAKADGGLFEIPGGDAKAAFGFEYRREKTPLAELEQGGFITIDPARNITAIFGELYAPLVSETNTRPGIRRLDLSLASRFDHYSDIGGIASPKVALLWSPIRQMTLKATYGRSFTAPVDQGFASDTIVQIRQVNELPFIFIRGGRIVDPRPEKSENLTITADFQPDGIPSLNVSLSYFNIQLEDRIARPSAVTGFDSFDLFESSRSTTPRPDLIAAVEDVVANSALPSNIPFPTCIPGTLLGNLNIPPEIIIDTGNISGCVALEDAVAANFGFADLRPRNMARTRTQGLDFEASYGVDTDFGHFDISTDIKYIFSFKNAVSESAPLINSVNTLFNPVDLQLRNAVSWRKDGFSGTVFVNYTNNYKDEVEIFEGIVPVPPAPVEIGDFTTIDLNFSYDFGRRFGPPILDDVIISVAVLNAANQSPPTFAPPPQGPFSPIATGPFFDPLNANAFGRNISFRISKGF